MRYPFSWVRHCSKPAPIVALHLTRPTIEIPRPASLGIPSHFEAARGAYVVRDYDPSQPKGGTVIVQGTSAMASIIKALPELKSTGIKRQSGMCDKSPVIRYAVLSLSTKGFVTHRLGGFHRYHHPGALVNARLAVQ